jgi:hypothetical protein
MRLIKNVISILLRENNEESRRKETSVTVPTHAHGWWYKWAFIRHNTLDL